jgi:hypothetical protein
VFVLGLTERSEVTLNASSHKRYFITFGRAINSILTWFGDEFSHRAKSWLKGERTDEMEERTTNIRAVNLISRY